MTNTTLHEQGTFLAVTTPTLVRWVDGFFVARRAAGKSAGTLIWYKKRLAHFVDYCAERNVATLEAVDATLLREFLLELANTHNPGGVHSYFRALKAFLLWYEKETEPDGWRNPIRKVQSPKVPDEILEPVDSADVNRMLAACNLAQEGLRDKSILLTLLDSGVRASELCTFDITDFDPVTGALIVRRGKGAKGRTVFLGHTARRALRAYLKGRGAVVGALFATKEGTRLTYRGLRSIVERRARDARLKPPSIHSFRRACALSLLRAGVDLITIQRLLGHANLLVLQRYLRQNADDLRAAVEAHSPADKL